MTDNKVKLNDDKTEIMIISPSRMSTSFSIRDSFATGNTSVPFSVTVNHLGVTLDCHLYSKPNVVNHIRTANFERRRISFIRHLLTTGATANSLLSGCPHALIVRLHNVQYTAARLILRNSKHGDISLQLASPRWLSIDVCIIYNLASISYHCLLLRFPRHLESPDWL